MKYFFICLLLFSFSVSCFGETDLNGKWFCYLEKNGVIVFRANYDCIIQNNAEWSFIENEKGKILNSGRLIWVDDKLYLGFPKTADKTADKKTVSGIFVSSYSSSEFRIHDTMTKTFLVFRKQSKQSSDGRKIIGTWQFWQKDLNTSEKRKAGFKITFSDNNNFSVQHTNSQDDANPKSGSYHFQNGFLVLDPKQPTDHPFWKTPIFFFDGELLILNHQGIYVFGKKE